MVRVLARRLAAAVLVAWLVVTATFVLVHLAPGSYEDVIAGPDASTRLNGEALSAIRAHWGLDLPLGRRYLRWLASIATGDLGISFVYRQPVTTVLAAALPPTVLLTGTALLLDLLLGTAIALAAVRRPGGWLDRVLTVLAVGVWGIPTFWLAVMAVLVFSVVLGWLPPAHMRSVGASAGAGGGLGDLLRHLILPAACLGVVGAGGTARYLRAALLELRDARYLLAARARGIPEARIRWLHALRPALLPVITLLGLSVPILVSGALVIEVVFAWPGMGRVALAAATARDVPLLLATTLLSTAAVLVGTLLADLSYRLADPRVREAV